MAQMGEDAESAGAELSVHDLDFMLNHVEPAGAFDLSITESAGGAFRATGTIGGVPTEFRSGWTDAENITEAVVTELDGSIRVIDLSSGGRPGRIAALRHQLSHVLGAAGSDDLSKDERVLGFSIAARSKRLIARLSRRLRPVDLRVAGPPWRVSPSSSSCRTRSSAARAATWWRRAWCRPWRACSSASPGRPSGAP